MAILLADFDRCRPTVAVALTFGPGRWRLLPYRAEGVDGFLLGAAEESEAPEIAYPVGRTGRFRISLGIFNGFWRPYREQRLEVRLGGEADWTTLTLAPPSDLPWGIPLDDDQAGPRITEVPWTTADLAGRDIHLRQPRTVPWASQVHGAVGAEVYVAYIRLDPVEDDGRASTPAAGRELELFAYNDTWDCFFERSDPLSLEDGRAFVRASFAPYRGTDFTRMYWEVAHGEVAHYPSDIGRSWADFPSDAFPRIGDRVVVETWRSWRAAGYDPLAEAVAAARATGVELHATFRLGWGAFYWPPPFDAYNTGGRWERHPEWRVRRPDGTLDTALSFAHPEVRGFVVDLLREVASRYAVDGVALLFNRQPPFVEEGDRDSVTRLLRELRAALGSLPITTWVFGREADNRATGLDAAMWVREGLVQTLIPYASTPRGFSWGDSWTSDAELRPWLDLTRGTGTLLAPNVMPRDLSDRDHRRQALRLARAGVDALAFWDTHGRRSFGTGVLGRLGHVRELEAWAAAGEPPAERPTRRILEVAGWRFTGLPE
ncbi:MAG: hypothetical protein FJ038_03865 [Chloroflexi bacterium]|nr:hypothetical protein [Chloroflexota bacterium]